jgi:hypothetical protein
MCFTQFYKFVVKIILFHLLFFEAVLSDAFPIEMLEVRSRYSPKQKLL